MFKYAFIILSIILYGPYLSAEENLILLEPGMTCITASCHAKMGEKKYVHAVGINKEHCTKCHELIEEGEHRFEEIPEDARSLCIKCHSEEFTTPSDIKGEPPKVIFDDEKIVLHAPFAEGKCTECHDAHESNFYKHLKSDYPSTTYASYSVEKYSMCLKCHKEFEKALSEPRTLTGTMFRNGNLNLHFRHVSRSKSRVCSICHHHHGSKNPKLIRREFQFGKVMLPMVFKKTDAGGSCSPPCHATVQYDRYDPFPLTMKTTTRPGIDAIDEELILSRERDMQIQKEKEKMRGEQLKNNDQNQKGVEK